MSFFKLLRQLILMIYPGEVLSISPSSPAIASPKFNQDKIQLITSSQDFDISEKSRLDQSLEMINEMDDSQAKVILLNSLALNYARLGDREYEYDYIDFEQRRNQVSPTLGIILLGRGFSMGEVKLNHTFSIVPALNNFDNYIISSDSY